MALPTVAYCVAVPTLFGTVIGVAYLLLPSKEVMTTQYIWVYQTTGALSILAAGIVSLYLWEAITINANRSQVFQFAGGVFVLIMLGAVEFTPIVSTRNLLGHSVALVLSFVMVPVFILGPIVAKLRCDAKVKAAEDEATRREKHAEEQHKTCLLYTSRCV